MKYKWKTIFLMIFGGLSSHSWGAEPSSYQIFVGNHQHINLKVSTDNLDLVVSYMNNTSDHVLYRRTEKSFVMYRDRESQIVINQDLNEEYVRLALRLRDYVAMFTSPYPFGKAASSALHPELNSVIEELDQITTLGDQALANCILFPATGRLKPLTISAGIHGTLGAYKDNVSRIWVRRGYELVLLESPEFDVNADKSIVAKGNGQSTGKGLSILESQSLPTNLLERDGPENTAGGAHFALSRTSFENRVGSILCRPDLFY